MRKIKYSVCGHDCPDTCGLRVEVENERIKRIFGDPEHPFTQGFICHKVRHYADRVYSPLRIMHPLKRTGAKGKGLFVEISWPEAIAEIGDQFRQIISEYGPEAILPYSYAGNMGVINRLTAGHRFFHRLGASRLDRTICSSTSVRGLSYTNGTSLGMNPEDFSLAKMIILWGANPLTTNLHLMPFIRKARKKGAKITVIDPHRNRLAKSMDRHIPIRPGTDAALAMAMMNVIITKGKYDTEYVKDKTLGFDALKKEAERFSPDAVSRITGISIADIERLADDYATIKPSAIRLGLGMQRHSSGGMAFRTIACLPALTGNWKMAGGGASGSCMPAYALNFKKLYREELIAATPRAINMIRLGDALTRLDAPPVKSLFVYNSNPAVVAPLQSKVLEGLKREDLFTVVHDLVATDTTDYADIVLPAASFFEFADLYAGLGHFYMQMAHPVIEPVGQSKSNFEVFRLLAMEMRYTEACFSDSEEDIIRQAIDTDHPFIKGLTFDALSTGRPLSLNLPKPFLPFAQGFPTPSGKAEFFSRAMEESGLPPVATHVPSAEGCETVGLDGKFPLHLITPRAHNYLNSSFGAVDRLRRLQGRPMLKIHPVDATQRDILIITEFGDQQINSQSCST
ncbi:molybdopterin-dependent oxidoreductase, partial [Thermodesulfobacteriota bacterium]